MSNGVTQVLVVGAGPTGLTAACELARRGVNVRIVAATGPFEGSRGKGVQPRTLELLDRIGLADHLIARGRFDLPIRRYEHDGKYVDHDRPTGRTETPETPYQRTLLVPQWRVEEALRNHLAELGVAVEWSMPVSGLVTDATGATVTFEDGTRVSAEYVVGCDGGSSTVRGLVGAEFLGSTHEEARMLLGDVVLDGLDRDHWHVWSVPEYPFVALCPLPATDTYQLQIALAPDMADNPDLAGFQAIVDRVSHGIRIRETRWTSTWRLNVRMVEHYRFGRVFLAGDAAHVHSPAGGQGMNTGIQDAINLAWKISHVLDGAPDDLLDSYEAERLPVAADVLGLSNRLTGKPIESRDVDDDRSDQLDITYRGGPLSPATPGEGLLPGDRAPDAPCRLPDGSPVRLFELQRGPEWTILAFGTRPETPEAPVRVVTIGTDVLDEEGHARQAFGASDGELVLIRPDGYIGTRGYQPADIADYLTEHIRGMAGAHGREPHATPSG